MVDIGRSTRKVGLALGGGFARGIANVGVLRAFEEHGVPIHAIAGVSAGSIVGGLYAAGTSPDGLYHHLKKLRWRDVAGIHFSKKSMVSSQPLERLVHQIVGKKTFGDLNIPFAAVATDLMTGERVVLNEPDMDLTQGIRASASFPGIFSPITINGRMLVDGGISGLPVSVLRDMGADVVIAVDVIPHAQPARKPRNLVEITDRGLDLLFNKMTTHCHQGEDYMLRPLTCHLFSFQLSGADQLVDMGYQCVQQHWPDILSLMG